MLCSCVVCFCCCFFFLCSVLWWWSFVADLFYRNIFGNMSSDSSDMSFKGRSTRSKSIDYYSENRDTLQREAMLFLDAPTDKNFSDMNYKKNVVINDKGYLNQYKINKRLGEGRFGKVVLAEDEAVQQYAIKCIRKSRIENERDFQRIRRETKILASLRHPNLVKLYEVLETEKAIYIVMEYASGGDLYQKIISAPHQRLPLDVSLRLFRQMMDALQYCHSHFVVHRDLKPENILLDKTGLVKIGDFGFSRTFNPLDVGLQTSCGRSFLFLSFSFFFFFS